MLICSISFEATSTLTFKKQKLCGLSKFPIADTFGWFQNFVIAFKAELEIHSAEKPISLNSGIFKCCTKVEKKEFSILAFPSLVVIILS